MQEQILRGWIDDVRAGRLPRRAFVGRLLALGIAAPLASSLLAAAGVAHAETASAYKPTRRGGGGALKLLFWQGPTLLNPHFATGAKDAEGAILFYDALARYDPEGNLVPLLAADIPSRDNGGIAADGRSTTWKLKNGVRWHDGRPFTADDVVFNHAYAADPATAAITSGQYEGVRSVTRIDAETVRFTFDKPTPQWSRTATVQLVPKHLFERYAGAKSRDAPANLRPVGTGPYRFVEFKPGDLLRAEINNDYYLPNRPHFDTVELKGGGDATSAARTVLQTGEYDFAWNLQVEDDVLRRMEASRKGRVVTCPSGDVEAINFNHADPAIEVDGERSSPKTRHPVLGDGAVREALTLLLDRKNIQAFVYGRAGVATPNVLNNPARYNSPNVRDEFSVERANAVLDAAGWKRGGDGVREKDGHRLRLLFQTSINSVRQKVQSIYKQSCARAGIELELKAVTASVFFSSDVANPDTYGKFLADLQMFANSGREPDPGQFMQWFVSWQAADKANKWNGVNRSRYRNDEYDRMYRASEVELDPVKRTVLLIAMNDLLCREHAILPLVYRPSVHGIARQLVAPISGWDGALTSLSEWYSEA
ncbi:MAG TPA: peptide ABC transporter substrate-binding protein [Caldimonas sp.]|jgi:peptide/nickel transport system substrate-binding protein|nr:peptide ABC transporter substrate-binding protein [Caldimonas sp.]HEX4233032.1 peptide ABC transporter substrate-binding protein [Caldimonas sp.]